jgi:predicted ATPase/DNA-binding SARP family transcriptional activator
VGELRPHVAVGEPGSGSRECGSSVRIRLLGGFSVAVAGTPVSDPWRLRKARTLVKLLALAPGRRQPRDQVTEVLWPGASRRAGINNFHQVVHAVRRVIGPDAIALDDTVVRLNSPDVVTVDIDDFERAADDRTADLDVTLRAARLWTGQLLPEDLYADWAAEPRRRFDDLHATLIARLGRHLVEAGRVEDALAHLEPLAESRPVDEGLHRMLIRALADSGRRWDAFAAYERLRSAVDQEYAAEPEPPTRELYRRLLTGGPSSAPVAAHRLPAPTTSFVGRRRVLAELAQDLGRTRMMTLAGVGGVGKSRIALELARHQSGRAEFRDGVWLVELAGVAEPNGVAATCASALRVILPSGSDPVAALARELADRALLLVIDNCEHLLDAVSALVGELLARCLDVVVVATSREPLGLPGELIYRVPSLELPSAPDGADLPGLARLESVQLFVERARLVVPSFAVGPDTAEPVIRICRQLDGIPLALELAAARLAHRTVAELADGLVDALTVLGQQLGPRGRGRQDRQQTIGATLEWSHAMLAGDEVAAFRRLAVFAGGFDIAAAGSICGMADPAIVAAVSRLVDKSLVQADTSGTTTRYRLLEVVRQFAIARLIEAGEGDDCRRRHLRFFVAAAGDHDPDRRSVVGEPSEWFDLEQDNLRAAMSTALVEDPVQALRLAIATWRFWVNRGLIGEGARWLDSSLRAYPERSALRARALSARSVLLVRQGRDTELADIGAQIVDLLDEFGDPGERAHARHQRALLTFMAGDWGSALAQTAEGLSQSEDSRRSPPPPGTSPGCWRCPAANLRRRRPSSRPRSGRWTGSATMPRRSSSRSPWRGSSTSGTTHRCLSARRRSSWAAGWVRARPSATCRSPWP